MAKRKDYSQRRYMLLAEYYCTRITRNLDRAIENKSKSKTRIKSISINERGN